MEAHPQVPAARQGADLREGRLRHPLPPARGRAGPAAGRRRGEVEAAGRSPGLRRDSGPEGPCGESPGAGGRLVGVHDAAEGHQAPARPAAAARRRRERGAPGHFVPLPGTRQEHGSDHARDRLGAPGGGLCRRCGRLLRVPAPECALGPSEPAARRERQLHADRPPGAEHRLDDLRPERVRGAAHADLRRGARPDRPPVHRADPQPGGPAPGAPRHGSPQPAVPGRQHDALPAPRRHGAPAGEGADVLPGAGRQHAVDAELLANPRGRPAWLHGGGGVVDRAHALDRRLRQELRAPDPGADPGICGRDLQDDVRPCAPEPAGLGHARRPDRRAPGHRSRRDGHARAGVRQRGVHPGHADLPDRLPEQPDRLGQPGPAGPAAAPRAVLPEQSRARAHQGQYPGVPRDQGRPGHGGHRRGGPGRRGRRSPGLPEGPSHLAELRRVPGPPRPGLQLGHADSGARQPAVLRQGDRRRPDEARGEPGLPGRRAALCQRRVALHEAQRRLAGRLAERAREPLGLQPVDPAGGPAGPLADGPVRLAGLLRDRRLHVDPEPGRLPLRPAALAAQPPAGRPDRARRAQQPAPRHRQPAAQLPELGHRAALRRPRDRAAGGQDQPADGPDLDRQPSVEADLGGADRGPAERRPPVLQPAGVHHALQRQLPVVASLQHGPRRAAHLPAAVEPAALAAAPGAPAGRRRDRRPAGRGRGRGVRHECRGGRPCHHARRHGRGPRRPVEHPGLFGQPAHGPGDDPGLPPGRLDHL